MPLRTRTKRTTRADKRAKRTVSSWDRALGLAPGEQPAESFVAYFEPGEVTGEFAAAYGLRERGELVNAVFTDRGRLVLRIPEGPTRSIAFDAKRPVDVEILGPNERRLLGTRGGAERTQLVEVSSRGGAKVRIIVPESGVDALVQWGQERTQAFDRISA